MKVPRLPNNAYGIDISRWDITYNPDVKPIDFIIQRVSYADGTGVYKDLSLESLYVGVSKVPIRGAYHYWSILQDLGEQINTFYDAVKDKNFHFYVLDFEQMVNIISKKSADLAYEWIKNIRIRTGKKVLLYINRNNYNQLVAMKVAWLDDVELWIAQWPYVQYINNYFGPALPSGRSQWTFWQYGGDVANTAGVGQGPIYGVGSRDVDLNVFNGTVEKLAIWANITPPPPLTLEQRVERIERILGIIN